MLITRSGSEMAPSWSFEISSSPDININAHVQIPRNTALPVIPDPIVAEQQLAGMMDLFQSPLWQYRKPIVLGGLALLLFGVASVLR